MTERRLLNNKIYLYLTEFFAGMAIMAVELGASRLMAPYFSSSQIVWTIIISTIMIAMALGNIYGGKSADKDPDPDRLYRRLLIAAVWIAAIPVLGKYIILGITGVLIVTISHNLLVIAGFVACIVIFVFPCFLLGTVTPSLTKFALQQESQTAASKTQPAAEMNEQGAARGLKKSGSIVGRLNAANTIGSIIGTFTPTFLTIPAVGTAITFLIFSAIILLLALIYFISTRTKMIACIVATVLFILCAIFGHRSNFAFWNSQLTYEGESIYNYLQVQEDDDSIRLSTNVVFGVQSIKPKHDDLTGMYYDYALAAPVMAGEASDILVLGNGTGTFAAQCLTYFDRPSVKAVEIDEKITDLAHTYFDMPDAVDVTTYDGRAYLQADKGRYDVIMVDAYQDISIPFQMASVEFFTLVRDHLKEDGVMVVNMNMRAKGEDSINDYLTDTIAAVFPHVATVDVDGYTNRELFASRHDVSAKTLEKGIRSLRDPSLQQMLEKVSEGLVVFEDTDPRSSASTLSSDRILTDDRAPVELLSMRAIDGLIADETSYYRNVFKEEGLRGLLDSL